MRFLYFSYVIDEMNPDKKDEPEDYEILSKEF